MTGKPKLDLAALEKLFNAMWEEDMAAAEKAISEMRKRGARNEH